MASMDIPLWVKVLGAFIAIGAIFLLAAGHIIMDWITYSVKGLLGSKRRK